MRFLVTAEIALHTERAAREEHSFPQLVRLARLSGLEDHFRLARYPFDSPTIVRIDSDRPV
jgi:hypothetical protein